MLERGERECLEWSNRGSGVAAADGPDSSGHAQEEGLKHERLEKVMGVVRELSASMEAFLKAEEAETYSRVYLDAALASKADLEDASAWCISNELE